MKCRIQWIDQNGRPTPDDNEATAMAHAHEPIWLHPHGGIDNRVVGYREAIRESFPICAQHLATVRPGLPGWSFTPLDQHMWACDACAREIRIGGVSDDEGRLALTGSPSPQDARCDLCAAPATQEITREKKPLDS